MTSATEYLLAKLELTTPLKPAARAAVLNLPIQIREFRRGATIVKEGDRPKQCFAILQGATAMVKVSGAGERHIVIFHLPGDFPDLHSLHLERMDAAIEAVVQTTVGFVSHDAICGVCEAYPEVNSILWRSTLVDASVLRECALNIAARPALTRVAHLLCEFVVRLKLTDVTRNGGAGGRVDEDGGYHLPIPQVQLADGVGLSNVHMNRVLQSLRKKGLIDFARGRLKVRDWEALRTIADFDPLYLHLTPGQREILEA